MEERVVTVKINATVDGKSLDVCGANIILGINEIPRIELFVPPTDSGRGKPLKPKAFRPRISDFSDLYAEMARKAEGLKTRGNIDITITTDSTGKKIPAETLHLKNWVLSGVGLSSVSASAAPHMTLILMHPVCYLTKVGSIYETPKDLADATIAGQASSGTSFLEIIDKVYTVYRTVLSYFEAPGEMPTVYRENLGVGDCDPEKYIKDGTSQLFMCNVMPEAKTCMAIAIGRMVCPMSDGSSTWDMIVRVASEQMLTLVQTEQTNFTMEKGLLLEPIKPWRTDRVLTLDEERCMMTDIPGQDRFKLVGVMARKLAISGQRLITWANVMSDRPDGEKIVSNVLYCPVQPERADGRIMVVPSPRLLHQAFMEDGLFGSLLTNALAQTAGYRLNAFTAPLEKYCQAVYETTYGSMNSCNTRMALGFKDANGKWLLPGNTCKFVSHGKSIYYGYLRNVVHSLNTEGGCATILTMSYVRPTETVETIPDGNKNAVYD